MKNIFERRTGSMFPLGAKITGGIFTVIGFFAVLGGFYLAIIIFMIGLFVCFAQSGIQIDFDNNTYKEYWGLFSMHSGKWKKLPPISRVTVLPFTKTITNNLTMGGAAANSTERSFRVYLKGVNPKISIVAADGNITEALEDAQLLGEKLMVNILDCTGKEKKLIKIVDA
jgi:hypothetical protein